MNPSAMKPVAFTLTALALGGCYYSSPYGYAPYYAPAPATLSQRETPVAPTATDGAASTPDALEGAPPPAEVAPLPAPVYVAPAVVPYPYYYPPYYPGWYDWGWPPVAIGLGFWGGHGWGGHRWHTRGGGGHWGSHWEGMRGGHRH